MALHIINRTPNDTGCWEACTSALAPGDVLLLIEDGVYAAMPALAGGLPQTDVALWVLEADCQARGVTPDARFNTATDADFVDLTCQHSPAVSWF